MLALEIAGKIIDLQKKEILPLEHIMHRGKADREPSYQRSTALLQEQLDRGLDVALVNLGDSTVYASGQYLLRRLADRGYPTAIVPGVPSFCAAAARLGVSLTEMNTPLHIVPASADLSEALRWPGTKVIMKSGRELPGVLELLEKSGMLAHSAAVCSCGMPEERIWPDLSRERPQPEQAGYFTLLVVWEENSR